MSLAVLQEQLQARVLGGECAIETHVNGDSPEEVGARLAIYAEAYRARLTEALASNYPALAKLLGTGDFATLAGRYIATHVSRRPSIRCYGDHLPRFLAADAGYRDVPLLAELAAWEWAMTEVFDAADASAIAAEALARVPPEEWAELRFSIQPAVRLLELRWNVPPLWKALTGEQPHPPHELAPQPQAWLLWRDGLQVMFRSLGAQEAAALRVAMNGGSFGELCVGLGERLDAAQVPAQAAAYLRGWLEAGLITGIHGSQGN
jgi:hypothetical protein